MKLKNKTKGAVSIFLVIILVPMMTFSALFVDYSKVKLSKGVLESAGDLTLNTALTDYDTQLKDLYGLFGTAQDTEDLFSKLEEYYRTSITSSGVDPDSAADIAENLMAQLGLIASGDETSDLLNMELVDFNVSKLSNAHLANAAVLKDQIVEFEKYRAPINTGLSFVSSLKSFASLKQQTDLVDKRKEYYEEEKSVMESAEAAWQKINEYNGSKFITDDNYFAQMKEDFNTNFAVDYNEIASKIIKDLYDTQDYVGFTNLNRHIEDCEVDFDDKKVNTLVLFTTSDDSNNLDNPHRFHAYELDIYSEDNPPSTVDYKNALIDYYNARSRCVETRNALLDINIQDKYNLQFLVQNNRINAFQNWTEAETDLYDYYAIMVHTDAYAPADVKSTNEKLFNDIPYSKYEDIYNALSDNFAAQTPDFNNNNSAYNSLLASTANGDAASMVSTSGVESKLSYLSALVDEYRTQVLNAKDALSVAVEYLEDVKSAVQSGGDLDKKKNAWKSATDAKEVKNTSMARQDKAEIQSLATYLNSGDVQKLIDRLNNIIPNLENMLDEIDSYEYFDESLQMFGSYDTFKNTLGAAIGDDTLKHVPINTTELNNKVKEWTDGKYTVGNPIDYSWSTQSGSQAKLAGSGTDKLNFYSYLYTHFNKGPVSNKTEKKEKNDSHGEDLYNNVKSTSKEQTEGNTNDAGKGNSTTKDLTELKDIENRPSDGKGANDKNLKVEAGDDATSKTSKNLGDMFGSIGSQIADMGKTLRDDIYVTDYITGMFSYDTIEKELAQDPKKAGQTPKSITKQDINSTNNAAYGREVEYIIYGGSNSGNVTKAYASIYAIRLGFNLIYAFMNSEIRETALAIATPISAATLGVIPVPLIQAAIIIGLSCAESGIDLSDIKDGKKVVLFKNDDTWRCSIKGLVQLAKEKTGDLLKAGVDAGSNILGDMLDKTDEELTSFINEKSDDFKNQIGSAYDSMITDNVDTVIQQFTGFVRDAVQGEMIGEVENTTGYVKNKLDGWLAEQPNDGMVYNMKSKAVDLIKSKYIDQAVQKIKSAGESAVETVDNYASELSGLLQTIRNDIDNSIIRVSDELKNYKDEMIGELKDAAKDGAQNLKSKISEKFGSAEGTASGDTSDGSGLSSILKFAYSDYLKLFVLIGLFTDEEGILLRTADAIQANMSKVTNTSYKLADSAVYVKLDATVQVKPTLLALPLFSDVEQNLSSDTAWYTINYSTTKGY